MRDPEAFISRNWRRLAGAVAVVVLAIVVWARNPYPAGEVAQVADKQAGLQRALAANWQKHPSEELVAFMGEAAATDLLLRISIDERNRMDPPACGWVTRRCLAENRRLPGLAYQAYPEGTAVGDMLCRATFHPDGPHPVARRDVLGFVVTMEGCFQTVWSRQNGEWQVRAVAEGLVVDQMATLMKRLDREDPGNATAARLAAASLLAKKSDDCP